MMPSRPTPMWNHLRARERSQVIGEMRISRPFLKYLFASSWAPQVLLAISVGVGLVVYDAKYPLCAREFPCRRRFRLDTFEYFCLEGGRISWSHFAAGLRYSEFLSCCRGGRLRFITGREPWHSQRQSPKCPCEVSS